LLSLINKIENGQATAKVKEQIKRILAGQKMEVIKENVHPNVFENQGRLSLQPQVKKDLLPVQKKRGQNHDVIQVKVVRSRKEEEGCHSARKPSKELVIEANVNPRSSSHPAREMLLPDIREGYDFTLVLDLDETLIHYDQKKKEFRIRPYSHKFLREMAKYYEIVIFTAALQDYADLIINAMDQERCITHRLYRDSTKFKNGYYTKDLSNLGRDLHKTIIIDNTPENFSQQEENGLCIKGWYNDVQDRELDKMIPFLRGLVNSRVPDVRPLLRLYKNQKKQTSESPVIR